MKDHVVVWDPTGEYWDGGVVSELKARELASRGVVTLPCVPETFTLAGFAGFAKRSWGSGWTLAEPGGSIGSQAPIAIFAPGEPHRRIHWAARLYGERSENKRTGILRLAAMEAYWNQHRAVISEIGGAARNAIEVASLEKPDEYGGWTVRGTARLDVPSPGVYGACVYGYAPGMRLAWLAVTLTP